MSQSLFSFTSATKSRIFVRSQTCLFRLRRRYQIHELSMQLSFHSGCSASFVTQGEHAVRCDIEDCIAGLVTFPGRSRRSFRGGAFAAFRSSACHSVFLEVDVMDSRYRIGSVTWMQVVLCLFASGRLPSHPLRRRPNAAKDATRSLLPSLSSSKLAVVGWSLGTYLACITAAQASTLGSVLWLVLFALEHRTVGNSTELCNCE